MRGLGYKSVSTVAIHIDNLITKGYLVRRDKSARSLDVVGRPATPGATTTDLETKLEAHVNSQELDEAQLKQVAAALNTLGFTKLAQKLEKTE